MVPCKSTAEEVSFEWSHHRILSTDLKVRTTVRVSIIASGGDRVKIMWNWVIRLLHQCYFQPELSRCSDAVSGPLKTFWTYSRIMNYL